MYLRRDCCCFKTKPSVTTFEKLVGTSLQTLIAQKLGFFLLHGDLKKLPGGDDIIGYKINFPPPK